MKPRVERAIGPRASVRASPALVGKILLVRVCVEVGSSVCASGSRSVAHRALLLELLGVDRRPDRVVITVAGHRFLVDQRASRVEHFGRHRELPGGKVVFEVLQTGRARNYVHKIRARENPGQRQLRGGDAGFLRQSAEPFDQSQVVLPVPGLERGLVS